MNEKGIIREWCEWWVALRRWQRWGPAIVVVLLWLLVAM